MNFSVCIDSVLMNEFSREQAIRELKKIGVKNFEFWSWWKEDISPVVSAREETGLNTVAFCTKYISLTDARLRDEYIEGLKESIELAKKLKCKKIISQTGNMTDESYDIQKENVITGLKECSKLLESNDITLVLEPINRVERPNYFLAESKEAFDIIDKVGSKNVKVLYDVFHQQITEGNIINTLKNNIDKIGHIHVAGIPERYELSVSEIDYARIFQVLEEIGYKEYIGLEYFPKENGLDTIKEILNMKF